MEILFVASECSPFVKTGGLADVVGTLPSALQKEGKSVSVVLPKYDEIPCSFTDNAETVAQFKVPIGWRIQYCNVEKLQYQGITYYFIDNEYYFNRNGLYGFFDEAERFVFFNRAVLEMLFHLEYKPDILHCHDWQASLISLFLNTHYKDDFFYKGIKTVFTVHNLKYQGIFPQEVLYDLLDLGHEYFHPDELEFYGDINFLKGALKYSDVITTVSESYAREIQTPYFGKGLHGLLQKRADDLYGIVNGIDNDSYDPATDSHVFENYERAVSGLENKKKNKVQLQKMTDLPVNGDIPVIIIISRLVEQKGFDLVLRMLWEMLELDLQLVILGTGEEKYARAFKEICWEEPDKVSSHITFNEDLARKMYAAGDIFLMPSQFEPCGIGQLIALRYLTVPVVRKTGGLQDTITDFYEDPEKGNGFSFDNFNAHEMFNKIKQALNSYHNEEKWKNIIKNISDTDYSWQKSAKKYIKIYDKLFD
ncbi:MAG: glycogen synthase GlgA [Bacillota bacterium]